MTTFDAQPQSAQNTAVSSAGTGYPTPAWRKAYRDGSRPDLRVPYREVVLTNGRTVPLYDTSGPYTDPSYEPDVRRGLPALRDPGSASAATSRSTTAARPAPRTTGSSTPRRAAGTCATSTPSSPAARAAPCAAAAAPPSPNSPTPSAAS